MMQTEATSRTGGLEAFRRELGYYWREWPNKGLFFACLAMWLVLFHFLGNATLGYRGTSSLFNWLNDKYGNSADNGHCQIMPFVILGLLWWKRKELLAVPKNAWWPGFGLVGLALVGHVMGYAVQQAVISAAAFFFGLYAVSGLVWGWGMLRASFFPMCLLVFCVPLSGEHIERLSFPLRLMATHITTAFSQIVLGISVIQEGTKLFNASHTYEYEIAAACSGMRSLMAFLALGVIYAFMMLKSPWRRLLMVSVAVPMAVAANVLRVTAIIVAAETWGQAAGNYVHESSWSYLTYIPTMGGILFCGHWLRENKRSENNVLPAVQGVEQKV